VWPTVPPLVAVDGPLPEAGVYAAVFLLRRPIVLARPAPGGWRLAAGWYVYVGRAGRHLPRRLARHGRRAKPVHWHIDQLSTRAVMLGALAVAGTGEDECRLAAAVAQRWPVAAPGFGSSDCRCPGHLLFAGPLHQGISQADH
jgi:sugar fermentation stimulation protein A